MATTISALALLLAAAAVLHAYFAAPLLFWPLVSLITAAAVLSSHSPLALSRRMTFLAHAQAHTILTAAMAAALTAAAAGVYRVHLAFYTLVLIFAVLLNVAVIFVERLGFKKDVATGVVMSFQLSATVALIYVLRTTYPTETDPISLITGEYVLVTFQDYLAQLPLFVAASIFPAVLGRKYLYAAVDEHFSQSVGINTRFLDYGFLVSMSLAVAASVYTLGSLMPAVLLVLPGAVATVVSHRLVDQIPASVAAGVIAASAAHFIYWAFPQIWPIAALGVALFLLMAVAHYK